MRRLPILLTLSIHRTAQLWPTCATTRASSAYCDAWRGT